MTLAHPLVKWELSCPHYFPTFYGRFENPCNITGKNVAISINVTILSLFCLQLTYHCLTWYIMFFLNLNWETYRC